MKSMLNFIKPSFFSLLICLFFNGCATNKTTKNHEYMPHKEKSYVVRGHNYTFAIYNNEHRLLTHPIEDLMTEMKWRKIAGNKKPAISDIYLISHGWNYTLPVAIANYHNYMERIDAFMKTQQQNNHFQPYFIFVTWTSTTRPTTDLIKAVLPFGIDSAFEPFTSLVDKVPLHILTAWKQSHNAAENALGKHSPNYYINKEWKDTPYGYLGSDPIVDDDATMGEDLPVSALVYKLIQNKYPQKSLIEQDCSMPDPFEHKSDICVPLTDTKIHLVGHSYGAKLVTLAGMESLRRWMTEGLAKEAEVINNELYKNYCLQKKHEEETSIEQCITEALSISLDTGHLPAGGELGDDIANYLGLRENNTSGLLKLWYDKNNLPIESLVLFNPAFSPGELSYPVEGFISAPVDTLRFIPRKAIVYSNSDYANGALFGLRDTVLDTSITQYYYSLSKLLNNPDKPTLLGKLVNYPIAKQLFDITNGVVSLAYGVGMSVLGYGTTSVLNLWPDFSHHVQTNTMDGLYAEISTEDDTGFEIIGKGLANSLDFFMPIKFTRIFSNEAHGWKKWPFLFFRAEKEQGLYRLNRPGLGKTGINNMAEGRILTLWGLNEFYNNEKPFGDYSDLNVNPKKNIRFAKNIDADTFCRFSGDKQINNFSFSTDINFSDFEDEELLIQREYFYSFDASKVYDSLWPPVGAHSDLRLTDSPDGMNCWNESTLEKYKLMEKRDYTFNLLLQFTKTNFASTLNKIEKSKTAQTNNSNEITEMP